MNNLYILVLLGAYRHNILKVYKDLADAKQAAISLILEEKDDYHDIEIVMFPLDSNGPETTVARLRRQDYIDGTNDRRRTFTKEPWTARLGWIKPTTGA